MNTILADSQFGFHHQHSTTQQLLLFLNKVHYCLNSNAPCDVTYLDFHKAFDSVSHKLLIKLWNIGITGNLWLWIKKYLSDRHQRLCIDGCYSSSLTVISGIPQGSILGPLVCACQWPAPTSIIHISLWRWYTKYLKSVLSVLDSSLLQQHLNHLSNWSTNWKLSFNESKCLLLTFQSKSPTHSTSLYFI